jgi:hypothetical protein
MWPLSWQDLEDTAGTFQEGSEPRITEVFMTLLNLEVAEIIEMWLGIFFGTLFNFVSWYFQDVSLISSLVKTLMTIKDRCSHSNWEENIQLLVYIMITSQIRAGFSMVWSKQSLCSLLCWPHTQVLNHRKMDALKGLAHTIPPLSPGENNVGFYFSIFFYNSAFPWILHPGSASMKFNLNSKKIKDDGFYFLVAYKNWWVGELRKESFWQSYRVAFYFFNVDLSQIYMLFMRHPNRDLDDPSIQCSKKSGF